MKETVNSVSARLWSNALFPGVTFTTNRYSHYVFQPHFHDHYVIMVVDEGVNEGTCEKKKYQVTTRDILFINPGEIHTGNSFQGKNLQYSALYIEYDFFTKHLFDNRGNYPPVFTTLLKTNADLASRVKTLIQSTNEDKPALEIDEQKAGVFEDLLTYSQSTLKNDNENIPRTVSQRVKRYIQEQYKEQFSLADLTGYVGLSPYYVVRSFKQAVGMTPFQFLRNYRVERAKQILKKKSIAEVAIDVGFYDQSHFHKHFKLVTGVTPREFQRQQQ